MTITFIGQYKSLKSFESEPLNKFTVITGENGCGKSQLLDLLKKFGEKDMPIGANVTLNPSFNYIQSEGLIKESLGSMTHENWKAKLSGYIGGFVGVGVNGKKLMELFVRANTWLDELNRDNLFDVLNKDLIAPEDLMNLIISVVNEYDPKFFRGNASFNHVWHRLENSNWFMEKRKTAQLAMHLATQRKKNFIDITDLDFYNGQIPDSYTESMSLFNAQLESTFYNYAKRRSQNDFLYYNKKFNGDDNDSISDSEFIEKHRAPWDIINDIFTAHKIKFKFLGVEKKDFSQDVYQYFPLVKTTTETRVDISNLSSGEKVIIGLIIKLFTNDYYQNNLKLPDLLILDEPDAHLHPEMSKLLIDVLHNTFVKELGIQVIMVTHSPSTVALCPDDSIYELKNEPHTSLKQISKDDALRILTGHLPTLSIDYKNHKQVFVESPTDIEYYQTIFNKLNEERNYPYRLYFISNSAGKGNCDQVIKIVNDIRTSGNKTSYGIIDWDLKNSSTDFIKVHGHGNRYSVENYLYDPIYISLLLMDLKAHDVYDELGLSLTANHYLIGSESDERLQNIVDWFFTKYYKKYPKGQKDKDDIKEIEYLNGKKIKMPKWYLEYSGHDLEKNIKSLFPAIDGKYQSEGTLQKDISIIIGRIYPLIPKDSVILIEELMSS